MAEHDAERELTAKNRAKFRPVFTLGGVRAP